MRTADVPIGFSVLYWDPGSSAWIPAHFDSMSIMHQAIQNANRNGWITDLLVPTRYWQLRGQNHTARLETERSAISA